MTKEEILEKRRHIIGNRLLPILSDTIYNMMDEYAQSISLAYDEWKWANRWHSLENGFWYQTCKGLYCKTPYGAMHLLTNKI